VAGRLLRNGQKAYVYDHDPTLFHIVDSPVFFQAARQIGFRGTAHPFVQAPLIALAFAPLSDLGFEALRLAWLLLSVVCCAAGIYLSVCLYWPALNRPLTWGVGLALLSGFEPMTYGLWLGQTTPLIFLLVMLSLALLRWGRPLSAGALLALAAFVKITPALLALAWLGKRSRNALWGFFPTLFVLLAASVASCGLELNLTYLSILGSIGRKTLVAYNNHSLAAFLTRFTADRAEWFNWRIHSIPTWVRACNAGLFAAFLLAAVFVVVRYRRQTGAREISVWEALALLSMLLFPSLCWTHYLIFVIPILAIVCSAMRRTFGFLFCIVTVALCSRPFIPNQIDPSHGGYLSIGAPTVALCLLCIASWFLVWRPGRIRGDAIARLSTTSSAREPALPGS
jgi:hypothetical protein